MVNSQFDDTIFYLSFDHSGTVGVGEGAGEEALYLS